MKLIKRFTALFSLVCSLFIVLAVSLSVSAANVTASVDFTTIAAKHSAYTDTWTYSDWTISGGANNNGGWAFVKMGGKSTNLSSYNKIYIASPVVASAGSKVEVSLYAGSVAKSGMSATIQIEVYSDAALTALVDSTSAQTVVKTAAVLSFEPNTVEYWPANSYYKVVFNCTNTSTTNGIVWLDGVSVYEYDAAAEASAQVEITGDTYTAVGDDATLIATVKNSTSAVEWKVSDENIALVDEDGVVTGVSMGTVTVTATLKDDPTVSDTFEVNVFPANNAELTIAQAIQVCEMTGNSNTVYNYSVTGVIESIDTAYDSSYGNISVTISDGTDSLKCFRLVGGEDLGIGDKIKVTGVLIDYNGSTPEFAAGCTYEAVADDTTVADLKESLNSIGAYMSLAYKYTSDLVAASPVTEFVAKDLGYANGVAVETVSSNNVSITFAQGSNSNNAPKYYSTGYAIRCYGGNTFTVEAAAISKIEMTFASGEGSNTITADSGEYADGVWTGEATSVTFTISGSSGHRRIATIAVTTAGETVVKEYSNVEFRLKCGVANEFADIETLLDGQEYTYGIYVATATKEQKFEITAETSVKDGVVYVVISLGDVLNNIDRVTDEFTIQAYVEYDGLTYMSESVKTYSVQSILQQYLNNEVAEVSKLVAELQSLGFEFE